MNNLFIITTPFQLLGALEAIFHFKLENNILIVIDNKIENNALQLTDLIENNKSLFINIIRHGEYNKSKFLNNILMIRKLKGIEYNNIFIGDLGSIQKIIISNLESNKIYLLDDGAKTILIHKKFKEKKKIFKKSFRQIRFNFFGLKTSTIKTINIFSFFHLDIIKNYEIKKHNFSFFKKQYEMKNKKIENKIFVLGQPLIENCRVKKEAYELYLNYIINQNLNCEINYLMHRREEISVLQSYSLNKELNIIRSTNPGEFFFAELNYKPKAIYGINTTLLFSLVNIFNDLNIYAYIFNDKDILKNYDWFKESVIYFEKNNIKLVGEDIVKD